MLDAYAYCEAVVRGADKDRYVASLFAPAASRRHLFALYAFAHEISRLGRLLREPMAGEIRLQWWREAVSGERHGEALANPVVAALIDTIGTFALPKQSLIALIDAYGLELQGAAVATLGDLDARARSTAGTLFALGASILARGPMRSGHGRGEQRNSIDDAAAPAGIALATAQWLCRFPSDVARHRILLPLEVLDRCGVKPTEIEMRQVTAGLRAALAALNHHAAAAYAELRVSAPMLPDETAPAFLAAAVVPVALARLDAATYPFAPVEVSSWRRQWAIWRAFRRWPVV
jgi:15-cis-phytoene synthase